ncbi:hypothetical protein OIU80_00365 [Flavobacterium sp. LS1R47]|jgi:hypothetical protein|uniref:Lipoprotein n=1 Tax=Flavobacterium frigoritolerans TaxID=2987686 RepID=A0A9X2ZG22_9FLAO|nr:hypothetical protein [Flavobacterium frigoritolerans]MCV9930721.1 hypothetical protein [Flavobacterium frigoritolerans]
MKKNILIIGVLTLVLASCKKEKPGEIIPSTVESGEIKESVGKQCFQSITNKDTVILTLNTNSHNEVDGRLTYKIYQKDKNEGTIIGNIKGDTLIADYTFKSEGVSSIREVAFLKKAGTFVEGYGDLIETNGKLVFKDKKLLKFDSKMTLSKVDCK